MIASMFLPLVLALPLWVVSGITLGVSRLFLRRGRVDRVVSDEPRNRRS